MHVRHMKFSMKCLLSIMHMILRISMHVRRIKFSMKCLLPIMHNKLRRGHVSMHVMHAHTRNSVWSKLKVNIRYMRVKKIHEQIYREWTGLTCTWVRNQCKDMTTHLQRMNWHPLGSEINTRITRLRYREWTGMHSGQKSTQGQTNRTDSPSNLSTNATVLHFINWTGIRLQTPPISKTSRYQTVSGLPNVFWEWYLNQDKQTSTFVLFCLPRIIG